MDDLFDNPPPVNKAPAVEEEEYESVLFVARESYVYRLPGGTASTRAANWGDMEAFLWKGRCRVMEMSKGTSSRVIVRLEDSNTGELFAQCPYDKTGKSVEPVLDSSRYFVCRVVDAGTGKHAYLGMGFQERSEAFDFQVALQDWQKRQRIKVEDAENDGATSSPHIPAGSRRDFSLKEGETISVRIGSNAPVRKAKKPESSGAGSAIPLLAPPPPAPRRH